MLSVLLVLALHLMSIAQEKSSITIRFEAFARVPEYFQVMLNEYRNSTRLINPNTKVVKVFRRNISIIWVPTFIPNSKRTNQATTTECALRVPCSQLLHHGLHIWTDIYLIVNKTSLVINVKKNSKHQQIITIFNANISVRAFSTDLRTNIYKNTIMSRNR